MERTPPFMQGDMKGVTQEEISKLTKAMKDDQFRSHMDEYCKEISDPGHRREYIQYLEQLEAKGEMPDGQQLLRTQPGCCVKTTIRFKNGQTQKLFINIVHSDRLDDLEMKPAEEGQGRQVYLPYSLSPPRPDRDLKDQYCMTCDCAVSSRTFFQAIQNPQILKMIVDTSADGLASNFLKGFEEVKKDFKVMEKLKCKGGFPMPMSVRAELLKDKGKGGKSAVAKGDAVTPSELRQMRQDAKAKRMSAKASAEEAEDEPQVKEAKPAKDDNAAPRIRVPKHRIIHSGSIDLADYMEAKNQKLPTTTTVPKVLKLVVELPTVKKTADVSLEVTCNNVVIEVAEKYYLDLPLPYEVEETRGTAKFDKAKQELTLELPVVPKMPPAPGPEATAGKPDGYRDEDDGGISERDGESDGENGLPPLEEEEPAPPPTPARAEVPAPTQAGQDGGAGATQERPRERLELEPSPSAPSFRTIAAAAAPTPEPPAPEPEPPSSPALSSTAPPPAPPRAAEEGPAFVPAEGFQGRRPGYYFGLGAEGLGYYRDLRQRPVRPAAPAPPVEEAPAALVEEVPARAPPPAPEPVRAELPAALRRYVDATAALSQRLPAGACDAGEPEEAPRIEGHQTRQNVLLLLSVPTGHEVADVQLACTGHRLSLALCTRPEVEAGVDAATSSSPPPRWRRHRLRLSLCGAVDARQWHATLSARNGAPQLEVVLRKARRGEEWPQVFDEVVAAGPAEAAAAPHGEDAAADGSQAEAADQVAADVDADVAGQDSAELDAGGGPPAAAGPAGATGRAGASAAAAVAIGGPQVTAPAAMVQSATAMGQSVLLRNRLMYQLL